MLPRPPAAALSRAVPGAQATINSLRFEHVGFITEVGAWWTIIGAAIVIIAIPCITVEHASPHWVFRSFETDLGKESGINNPL